MGKPLTLEEYNEKAEEFEKLPAGSIVKDLAGFIWSKDFNDMWSSTSIAMKVNSIGFVARFNPVYFNSGKQLEDKRSNNGPTLFG